MPFPNRGIRLAIVSLLVWCCGAGLFYRDFLRSHFEAIYGDAGDGRLLVYLHEHLFRASQRLESFASIPMFFPTKGTLGYSDALFLDGLFYLPFRWFGADLYLSSELTYIALSLVGFLSFTFVMLRFARVRPGAALAGALVFTFSSGLYKCFHAQFFSVYFIPVVVGLFLESLRQARHSPRMAAFLIFGCGLLDALLFLTGFYVAWFFNLFIGVMAISAVLIRFPLFMRAVRIGWQRYLTLGVTAVLGFAIGIVPFLSIYLPIHKMAGPRSIEEYLLYAPVPQDLFNTGTDNLVWGGFLQWFSKVSTIEFIQNEHDLSITPAVLVFFLIAGISAAFGRALTDRREDNLRIFVALSAITFLILFAAIVRVDQFSAFQYLIAAIPGASAIRVGGRFSLIVNGFAVAAATIAADRWFAICRPWIRFLIFGLVALGLAEQISLQPNSRIDRGSEMRRLEQVSAPPIACRAFYVVPRSRLVPQVVQDIDAILISQRAGLPTVNGYSGVFPKDWNLSEPNDPDYGKKLAHWIESRDLGGSTCAYDVRTQIWASDRVESTLTSGLLSSNQPDADDGNNKVWAIDFADHGADQFVGTGWHDGETWGRWLKAPMAKLTVPPLGRTISRVSIELPIIYMPDTRPDMEFRLRVNQCDVISAKLSNPSDRSGINLSGWVPKGCSQPGQSNDIAIETSYVSRPNEYSTSADTRTLSVGISYLGLQ